MLYKNQLWNLAARGVIGLLLGFQAVGLALAQTTNITSSGNLGTKITQSGTVYNIEGGTRPLNNQGIPANNVFHSFGRFDLASGNTANFVRPGSTSVYPGISVPSPTTVISRVTGGVPSTINGTLQALGWSSFYFINPSGVIFGPSATLNIPNASVYISTAHYLKFGDGGVFSTRPGTVGTELLSSSPVSSFGFLQGVTPAPITITGSTLTVGSGQTLSVIGGPITLDGAQLSAPNGKVQVASIDRVSNGQPVSYQIEQVVTVVDKPATKIVGCSGDCTIDVPAVTHQESRAVPVFLGYGGEVSVTDVRSINNLTPGSITMNPGSSFAALDAGANGTVVTNPVAANIQMSTGSQKIVQGNLVKVVTAPILGTVSPDLFLKEGETKSITISLNKPAEITETVSLTNSDSGTATISPIGPIIFNPGQQTSQPIQVTGLKQGNTQITATLRNVPKSATVVVNPLPPPPLTSLSPNLSLKVGSSGSMTVVLQQTFKNDLTIRLKSSDPSVASLNDSVTVAAGTTTSTPATVTGIKAGQTTIIATLQNSSVQALVDVTSTAPIIQTFALPLAGQYPRVLATPQMAMAAPLLLADKCAGAKDGQFSSFARLNRDSTPPQPGRYLSSPSVLGEDLLKVGQSSAPQISISMGAPKLLNVAPDATFLAMNACGR